MNAAAVAREIDARHVWRSLRFEYDDEAMWLTYSPYAIWKTISAAGTAIADDTMIAILSGAVLSWELVVSDDNPQPYPLDAEAFAELPWHFVITLYEELRRDAARWRESTFPVRIMVSGPRTRLPIVLNFL